MVHQYVSSGCILVVVQCTAVICYVVASTCLMWTCIANSRSSSYHSVSWTPGPSCRANDLRGDDGDANNGIYNAAQKLGKKARPRDLQLRRELQQQGESQRKWASVMVMIIWSFMIEEQLLVDAEGKNDTGVVYDHIPLIICRNFKWRWWN